MNIKKSMGALALAVGGASALSLVAAPAAFADGLGWSAPEMIANTGVNGVEVTDVNQQTFADIVAQITTFLFGLAIVAVVLRVVLTALDRLVFGTPSDQAQAGAGGRGGMGGRGRGGQADTILQAIPLVGAYPTGEPWSSILKNVIKNVAIVAGAWVLINFLVGIVNFIFTVLIVS